MKSCRHCWSVDLTASWRFVPVALIWLLVLAGCTGTATPAPSPAPTRAATSSPAAPSATSRFQQLTPTPTPTFLRIPTKSAPTRTPLPASTLKADAVDIQGVTIQLWYVRSEPDEMKTLINEFNATNKWGVAVLATSFASYGELAERVKTDLYAGLPDVLVSLDGQMVTWDGGGRVLVDLNAYAGDPVWGLPSPEQDDFPAAFWDVEVVNGKRLGVPFHRSGLALYYNITWAKALGFAHPPQTTQEFEQQACAAHAVYTKDADPANDALGGWIITADPATLAGWFFAFGAELLKQDGQGYQFDTPETRQAVQFLKKLNDAGCAWVSPVRYPNAEFAARQGLFATGSTAGLGEQTAAFTAANNVDQWTVIPFPAPSGEPAIDTFGTSLVLVQSTPARQLAAWTFVKWLTSPESQAHWASVYGDYPVRISALPLLGDYAAAHAPWAAAMDLLPYAHAEPSFASWNLVRWALGDAAKQLFAADFKAEKIPDLLKMLDQIAAETYGQLR